MSSYYSSPTDGKIVVRVVAANHQVHTFAEATVDVTAGMKIVRMQVSPTKRLLPKKGYLIIGDLYNDLGEKVYTDTRLLYAYTDDAEEELMYLTKISNAISPGELEINLHYFVMDRRTIAVAVFDATGASKLYSSVDVDRGVGVATIKLPHNLETKLHFWRAAIVEEGAVNWSESVFLGHVKRFSVIPPESTNKILEMHFDSIPNEEFLIAVFLRAKYLSTAASSILGRVYHERRTILGSSEVDVPPSGETGASVSILVPIEEGLRAGNMISADIALRSEDKRTEYFRLYPQGEFVAQSFVC